MNRKLTTKEFIERANILHKNKYDYSKTIYYHSRYKVNIICPFHGEFQQTPHAHLSGSGCPICPRYKHSKKLNTEEFIKRARKIHGDTYLYDKTQYINCKTPLTITCKIHGNFKQQPIVHLRGNNCPKCATEARKNSISLPHEEFVNRIKYIHPSLTVLEQYKGMNNAILVRDNLGIQYKPLGTNLMKGFFPSILAAVNKTDCFIKQSTNIHYGKYKYLKTKYVKNKQKVIITCPKHGDFLQAPGAHLNGQGCPECGKFNALGYSKDQWINFCNSKKDSNPKLYIIKCYNKNESFIKIGITTTSVAKRYKSKQALPYSYEVLKEIKGSADFIWDKEKTLHETFKKYKYKPKLYFGGETECFTLDILDNKIFN